MNRRQASSDARERMVKSAASPRLAWHCGRMNPSRWLASAVLFLVLSGCASSPSLVTDEAEYGRVKGRLQVVHRDMVKLDGPGGPELTKRSAGLPPEDLRCVNEKGAIYAPSTGAEWKGPAAADAVADALRQQGWTREPLSDGARRFSRAYPEGFTAYALVWAWDSNTAIHEVNVEPDGCSAVENVTYPTVGTAEDAR